MGFPGRDRGLTFHAPKGVQSSHVLVFSWSPGVSTRLALTCQRSFRLG